MRIIIAGGRDFDDYQHMQNMIGDIFWAYEGDITIISGGASGADALGEKFAKKFGLEVARYPAEWGETEGKPNYMIGVTKGGRKYWKGAGHARNETMAKNAHALIAFWDGRSKGTRHMIDTALSHKLTVHVFPYEAKV